MTPKKTIAVYVPKWLYKDDVGITIFAEGLYRSIQESGKYDLLKINAPMCAFPSREKAQAFVDKHNIALVVYHGSRVIPKYPSYEKGLDYLEACVPFLNPRSVHVADDKFETKRILRALDIPVLPETTVTTRAELVAATTLGEMYVAKPHDGESGRGVKLIKRTQEGFFEYLDRVWRKIRVRDMRRGLMVISRFQTRSYILAGIFAALYLALFLNVSHGGIYVLLSITGALLVVDIHKKITHNYIYRPLMLESFFGDDTEEFYCLRCTVLGDKVIEAAKKANKNNVTPNISHGGIASKIVLTPEQETMAVAATKAVGAAYAGIDLLVANGKTVVCEVNVGPLGVYCDKTGVDVGGLLGEYAMQRADELGIMKRSPSLVARFSTITKLCT